MARRPLFEDRADIRYFLSRLARRVRSGEIEVHSWCVLTTHFHLMIRSVTGDLSPSLGLVQNEYVRYFNRRHRRDGPLVRGRFTSRLVDSLTYRLRLLRYIDANPVLAGLAAWPWEYPFGSARQYVLGTSSPWLDRTWVEAEIRARGVRKGSFGDAYMDLTRTKSAEADAAFVSSWLKRGRHGSNDLDRLVASSPPGVLDWMLRKSALADGQVPGLPMCDLPSVRAELAEYRTKATSGVSIGRGRLADHALLAEVGLMRSMCGLTLAQVASISALPRTTTQRAAQACRELMQSDPEFARLISELGRRALDRCHGTDRWGA
ncbi:transposase [Engelhardtia mirabilis]|uniref:transposase n=1 Tax=Engelhardtia mirabilis TaxID=2528011 RepID=UPI003AF3D431